jgi:ribosome maturation factor RimP
MKNYNFTMNALINKIIEVIKPVFVRDNIYLVDVEFRGKGKNQVLTIYADTGEGITLKQITKLNNEINDLLDIHNVISGTYRLDISSPGIDRHLEHLWQYRKNIDRNLQVHYRENESRKELTGKLKDVNKDEIILEFKKNEIRIPFSTIIKSKVKVSV